MESLTLVPHRDARMWARRCLLVLVLFITSCVSSSVSVANATGGVGPDSLSVAVLAVSGVPTSTTVPAKTVKTVKPVKPKNKNGTSAVNTTVPVRPAVTTGSNISTGTSGSSGTASVVVLPVVVVVGLISVCVNKSTSVLRDTADNSCSSGSEVKVEWLDTGMSPKICVNNNNREMTLAQDGKCATKNSAVADVTVNKQILACADDKTGVLRYQASGICATNDDPVVWVLKDQGVARNVDSGVKKGVIEIISLIPTGGAGGNAGAGTSSGANTGGSTKTVTTSPTTNTSSPTTTTTTAVATAITTTTTSSSTTTTTTTIASRVSGSFAGYLGGTCPDGSGIPWYWGSGGQARAGGCSAAASIAPVSTGSSGSAATTTVAPVVVPGTPATPTGVSGNAQVTVSVTAGSGGTPTSYTVSASPQVSGVTRTCTVTGASGSCVVTGLTNGTAYTFTTTATNSAGTSGLSSASSAVTPATVPDAPTIGTATIASATSVTVSCTGPLQTTPAGSNGGATITTYTATAVGTAITGTLPSPTCSTAITVSGLTTGTAYTFTVTATNSAGTSVASAASNSVTPVATCATGGTCIVGNTGPGGGRVFYVATTGFNCGSGFTSTGSPTGGLCLYLEADSSDLAATVWCNLQNVITTSSFSEAIGAGYANTVLMTTNANCASGLGYSARSVSSGGKSDWYLPSNNELNQMCKWQRNQSITAANQAVMCDGTGGLNTGSGASGFSANEYRSSNQQTEVHFAVNAFSQNFSSGSRTGNLSKGSTERSRAIRAFG